MHQAISYSDALKKTFNRAKLFFVGFGFFVAALAFFLFGNGHTGSFRLLTPFHNVVADAVFSNLTLLGDGFFVLAIVAVFALLKKRKIALQIAVSYAISGLLSQLIKSLVVADRPKLFFEKIGQVVHEVPGVKMYTLHSFPSGHTTSAFALAAILALVFPSPKLQLLWLLLAITVGYSRVYLSQHFPLDVFGGAILGTLSSALVYFASSRSKI